MTFELERQLLDLLGDAVQVVDETSGFRYFDARDLLGFVDGTANPVGGELLDAALIGEEADPDFAGGSYVVVQKYVHDMAGWGALTTERQEAIMGRTKIDNIEIDDDDEPRKSHKSLATIDDGEGGELAILRDNMPFGRPGAGEFGTYFIGYAGRVWVIEQMLERMFVGAPPGSYDRLLDFSTAITGTTFFVPTATYARRPRQRLGSLPMGSRWARGWELTKTSWAVVRADRSLVAFPIISGIAARDLRDRLLRRRRRAHVDRRISTSSGSW